MLLWGLAVLAPHLVGIAIYDTHTLLEHIVPDLTWTLFLELTLLLIPVSDRNYDASACFSSAFAFISAIVCSCTGIATRRPGIGGGGALAMPLLAGTMLLLGLDVQTGHQRPPWVPRRQRRIIALCLMAVDSAASTFIAYSRYWRIFTRLDFFAVFVLYLGTMIAWSTLRWDHKITERRIKHYYAFLAPGHFTAQVMYHVWNNSPSSPMFIAGAFLLSALIAVSYMLWDWKVGTLPSESESGAEQQDGVQLA